MQVQEIMTKDVSSCGPETNAAAAAEIMWRRGCGSIPVVGNGGYVLGIVTDRDLFIALGTQNKRPAELSLGEIMNRNVSSCAPGDDLRTALSTMAQARVHRLLVTDRDGALKGLLSIDDVIAQAEMEGLSKDVLRTLNAIRQHQDYLAVA